MGDGGKVIDSYAKVKRCTCLTEEYEKLPGIKAGCGETQKTFWSSTLRKRSTDGLGAELAGLLCPLGATRSLYNRKLLPVGGIGGRFHGLFMVPCFAQPGRGVLERVRAPALVDPVKGLGKIVPVPAGGGE